MFILRWQEKSRNYFGDLEDNLMINLVSQEYILTILFTVSDFNKLIIDWSFLTSWGKDNFSLLSIWWEEKAPKTGYWQNNKVEGKRSKGRRRLYTWTTKLDSKREIEVEKHWSQSFEQTRHPAIKQALIEEEIYPSNRDDNISGRHNLSSILFCIYFFIQRSAWRINMPLHFLNSGENKMTVHRNC